MSSHAPSTLDEARGACQPIGVDWEASQFRVGMNIELEHGTRDPGTNVTGDDVIMTAKIALAHLNNSQLDLTKVLGGRDLRRA